MNLVLAVDAARLRLCSNEFAKMKLWRDRSPAVTCSEDTVIKHIRDFFPKRVGNLPASLSVVHSDAGIQFVCTIMISASCSPSDLSKDERLAIMKKQGYGDKLACIQRVAPDKTWHRMLAPGWVDDTVQSSEVIISEDYTKPSVPRSVKMFLRLNYWGSLEGITRRAAFNVASLIYNTYLVQNYVQID